LTPEQIEASKACFACLKNADVLLYCVCGAGKTEIAVQSIAEYLKRGLKVAYAISRKEVVIELHKRFEKIFPKADVIAVYGGHHDQLTGDLIVCTCHQLYRYYRTFDLLILDEVDAFPLKGNEVLMNISLNACKGRIIFSTATVDSSLQRILDHRNYKKVELYVRPSHQPLSIPSIVYVHRFFFFLILKHLLDKISGQCIIFVTNKKNCRMYYRIFSMFYPCTYVYSDLEERDRNIQSFRDKKHRFIFSTTVLERGITIKDVNVIILNDSFLFDQSNLIQMLGRVRRGTDSTMGDAYIISDHHDPAIRQTLEYLRIANQHL